MYDVYSNNEHYSKQYPKFIYMEFEREYILILSFAVLLYCTFHFIQKNH